jgi:hypothetical protein
MFARDLFDFVLAPVCDFYLSKRNATADEISFRSFISVMTQTLRQADGPACASMGS